MAKKYKISYKQTYKLDGTPYTLPLTEEEIKEKYPENYQDVLDFPKGYEQLFDRFGEEFFSLDKEEIIEKYGYEIYDEYENIMDELTIRSNNDSRIEIKEYNEPAFSNNGFFEEEEDAIKADPIKLDTHPDWDDGDLADIAYNKVHVNLHKEMPVAWVIKFGPSGGVNQYPPRLNAIGENNSLQNVCKKFVEDHKILELEYPKDNNVYGYTPEYAPYQFGRYKDEDQSRLDYAANIYAKLNDTHQRKTAKDFFAHPINFIKEWWNLKKIKNELSNTGFTEEKINSAIDKAKVELEEAFAKERLSENNEKVFEDNKSIISENEKSITNNVENRRVFDNDISEIFSEANSLEKSSFVENDPNKSNEITTDKEMDI